MKAQAAATGELPHVVIVGGGFGGLAAARALRRGPVRVTLVDRRNYHLFQPLLYQVATAALSPADIAHPIRSILRRQSNTRVLLAEAVAVDLAGRRLVLADGEVAYDHLVLATGAEHSYFGREDWSSLAPGLKTIEDGLEIRRRVLLAFEEAERTADESERRALLTFVVVGGGPTGVELAGALAEIARRTLARNFRSFDPAAAKVLLVEGGPRILPAFPEPLSGRAQRQLERLGAEVLTSCALEEILPGRGVRLRIGGPRPGNSGEAHQADPGGARAADSGEAQPAATEWVAARTVLWAAGVRASSLARSMAIPLDRSGRITVAPDLTVPGHPEVAVIGDLACFQDGAGRPLPGTAPVAMQQGRAAGRNILRAARGLPRRPFRYRHRGNLATIGKASGVADFGWVRLWGLPAWIAWCLVHILFLIGFRNRLIVMFEWAWAYVTAQRGARLITWNEREPPRESG